MSCMRTLAVRPGAGVYLEGKSLATDDSSFEKDGVWSCVGADPAGRAERTNCTITRGHTWEHLCLVLLWATCLRSKPGFLPHEVRSLCLLG